MWSGFALSTKTRLFQGDCEDPKTNIHDTGHQGFHIPLIQKGPGKAVDITMPIEEGDRYRLASITFKNNKAVQDQRALRNFSPLKTETSSAVKKSRKGWRTCAKRMASSDISISRRCRTRNSTMRRS